jgi:hypothetical protein
MPNLGLRISQANLNVIGAAIWGTSAIAGTVLLVRRQAYLFWSVCFLGFVAFLMFVIVPALSVVDLERQLPLRQMAESAVQAQAPDEKIVMITDGFEKPSLVFYTQQQVTFLHNPSKAISTLQNLEKQSNPNSVLVIARQKALEQTGLKPTQYQQISQAGIYQLVRVSREKEL